ncbi:MAG: aspartate carbamoyltransferase regulatory subunit [Bacteroidales bacterium]|jgi:aspartate carbamoyltransferase regulatory subunit|nr:aspartate carbamoyltransferase regulatory subunit [Bacteroidales bacterium]
MEKVKKQLVVSAIENGTVIDHIPNDNVSTVVRILDLYKLDNEIFLGANLNSKKYGKKGIIKIKDKFFEDFEINKIALVASTATIIEIKDYKVYRKFEVTVPETISGIIKCFNPKCVTNMEITSTKFKIVDKKDIKLMCHYCEKITKKETLEFF